MVLDAKGYHFEQQWFTGNNLGHHIAFCRFFDSCA
jgi:hypothetical protein